MAKGKENEKKEKRRKIPGLFDANGIIIIVIIVGVVVKLVVAASCCPGFSYSVAMIGSGWITVATTNKTMKIDNIIIIYIRASLEVC